MHINNKAFINQVKRNDISPGCKIRLDVLRHTYGEDVNVEYPLSFLDYLEWVRVQDFERLNPHHTPQFSEIYNYKGIQHYKLECFMEAIDDIEGRFGLRSSEGSRHLFTSGHHTKKNVMSKSVAMKVLGRSFPIGFWSDAPVPTVNQELLEGTVYGKLIEDIFYQDIDIYRSI